MVMMMMMISCKPSIRIRSTVVDGIVLNIP